MYKILIIDDQESLCYSLKRFFISKKFEVITFFDGISGVDYFKNNHVDIVLTDLRMPGINGVETLRQLKNFKPLIPVVLMTAYNESNKTVEAMSLDAYDFILKPFDNEHLYLIVMEALKSSISIRNSDSNDNFDLQFIGESKVMFEICKTIGRIAPTDTIVLLTGDSGTGKEVIAKLVHSNSSRADTGFFAINCAAIPFELFESELFGYEKGAFTGANERKAGLIESAEGSTIFFDEIGDMPLLLQVKILRLLDSGIYYSVGGKVKQANVRIIAATNQNLQTLVNEGKFRLDLFYRLNVFHVHLPPLKERREDIPALVSFFINKFNKKHKKNIEKLNDESMKLLMAYDFPGNIRELEHAIEKAVVLSSDMVVLSSFFSQYQPSKNVQTLTDTALTGAVSAGGLYNLLQFQAKNICMEALEKTGGNQLAAAKMLNISRTTLRKNIESV